ncbi:MAG: hypothetical protein JWL61_4028 [Gemmatimonadetes bacterium]|nr:hypothetical protein [Gemmatimonadota bacterium]
MRHLILIKHSEDIRNLPFPPGLNDAMGAFIGDAMKSGVLLDTAGLTPTADGARVRIDNRKLQVTDGPFTETKEIIGGYAMIEAKSRADAVDFATQFMELHRVHWPEFVGECEVRALESFDPPA